MSGAGLIGLVVYSLWQTLDVHARQAELDVRRQADFTAAALRAVLRDARFVELTPAVARFSVRDRQLVVDPAVEWLSSRRPVRREDLGAIAQDKLEAVERGELAPTRALFAELIRQAGTDAQRQWLQVEAGFHAQKARDAAWSKEMREALAAVRGGAVPAAAALLAVSAEGHLPGWAAARVAALPMARAEPLFGRLQELRVDVQPLREQQQRVAVRRERLQKVSGHVPALLGRRGVVMRGVDEGLLLVFHGEHGALLTLDEVRRALQSVKRTSWSSLPSDYALVAQGGPDDVTVVPDFLAVRPRAATDVEVDGAWILGLLALALGAICAAGLWVFYRSVRRETEAARVRSEFLTMVTHELKTPLAGIRVVAEMLQGGHVRGAEQHTEYYDRLERETVRLTMLIENVLDLGRMERGERAYDVTSVDVSEVVTTAVELFEPIAKMELRVVNGEPGPVLIRADRNALLQALLNVMDNARKYAAAGGRLDVEVSRSGYTCEIRVRDYGPGIAESERRRIFVRFQRGARHQSGSVPGVGLGLHLSREILRGLGGELDAVSPADGGPGVCFRFAVPVAPAVESTPQTNGALPQP